MVRGKATQNLTTSVDRAKPFTKSTRESIGRRDSAINSSETEKRKVMRKKGIHVDSTMREQRRGDRKGESHSCAAPKRTGPDGRSSSPLLGRDWELGRSGDTEEKGTNTDRDSPRLGDSSFAIWDRKKGANRESRN